MHFALHILHKLGLATYLHAVPVETVKTDQIVAIFWAPTDNTPRALNFLRPALLESNDACKLCPPLPQTSMYFLRTYSMLTLVWCCIHLCVRFKNVEMLSLVLDGISG